MGHPGLGRLPVSGEWVPGAREWVVGDGGRHPPRAVPMAEEELSRPSRVRSRGQGAVQRLRDVAVCMSRFIAVHCSVIAAAEKAEGIWENTVSVGYSGKVSAHYRF